jgi:BlaI family transcriptional regulator, penicillinase repressor
MRRSPKPTAAETEILNVLWQTGPATVRRVHAELQQSRAVGYTTVLKLMQIMAEKGLLQRDSKERAHVYRPAIAREATERQLVGDLLDRVFGGSAARLVLRALSDRPASRSEIAEIRRILDEVEKEKRR